MSATALEKSKSQEVGAAVSDPFMAMIQAHSDKPEVLKELIGIRNEEIARLAAVAFDEAYAEMQPNLPPVEKKGKSNNGKYAKWEDIQGKVNPVIHQYGFGLMFKTDTSAGKIKVTAILRHRQGHKESTDFELSPDKSGNKQDVHAVASAVSYAKRYAASALLNIQTVGEDDDANAATGGAPDDDKVQAFVAAVDKHKASLPRLLKAVGAETIHGLSAKQLKEANEKLTAWVAEKKAEAK